jgi:two-component system, sensor histidine kinase and response regulator
MLAGLFTPQAVERLRRLWQEMASTVAQAVVLTGSDLGLKNKKISLTITQPGPPAINPTTGLTTILCQDFLLLISPEFSVCLGLELVDDDYRLHLTFQIPEIQQFVVDLLQILPARHRWRTKLQKLQPVILPHDQVWQGYFALRLAQVIAEPQTVAVSAPIQAALIQQIDEERLLYEVVTQIRQTLDLSTILKDTIDKVQSYLQVDRLVIYQFDAKSINAPDIQQRVGQVAYESLSDPTLPSVLNFREASGCFEDQHNWHKYEQGYMTTVTDVAQAYRHHACFAQQMQSFAVRSKLVVPIVVGRQLWGLLIAHNCQQPYEWPAWQKNLLQKVSEHLELAVYQAEIHAQIQHQKLTLEQQVNRQTKDLRDALVVAQSASEAKTEFLAVLSHELRTPLTSILGLSYTLLNLMNSNLDTRQKNYLQTIKHSGDHLLELIEDMIEVSKLEAGRAVLKISDFSVLKLLTQTVQILQPRADQQKIPVQIQLMEGSTDITKDATQDIRFSGDIKRIKQVVINLLNNAIKFTEEPGEIILRAWREFDYLVLQVEDTGIGIAQDRIPLIFQKFQQLDSTLDREYEGMGLGLALTKQLVELHGGWIEVESTPGSGSTFTVWFASQTLRPPKIKTSEAALLNANRQEGKQNKTIVVVEDDQTTSSLISDILTAAGYQVVSLTETGVTHKQIELWQPDLVIIDQQIGEEHTNQILRYLHNLRESQHIRYLLIATTGQLSSKEQVMAVDRLFWDRIQPEQLLAKIARLF